jgi:hypothetical protein
MGVPLLELLRPGWMKSAPTDLAADFVVRDK